MILKNQRIGKITASQVSRLDSAPRSHGKGARITYIYEIVLHSKFNIYKNFSTSATRHGKDNEFRCFNEGVLKYFPFLELQSDVYIPIYKLDEGGEETEETFCGASPDARGIDFEGKKVVLDIKCNEGLEWFFYYKNNINKQYEWQVQMQMMAAKADYGILFFGAFKPEKYGEDLYEDYKFPFEDKFHYRIIQKNQEIQDKILMLVDEAQPDIKNIGDFLSDHIVIDDIDYLNIHKEGNVLKRIMDYSIYTTMKSGVKPLFWNNDFWLIKH